MKERHIPMEGTPNFRDLGGYPTRCGRTVRFGKLFRSGVLSALSSADLTTMQALNISTICDFRRHEEAERDPTRLPAKNPPRIVHIPIDPGSRGSFFEQLAENETIATTSEPFDMADFMVDINRAFALEHHESFKAMLNEIATLGDHAGLLFHCSAGKDRTGFGAALILLCLNVDRETIIEDYLLTAKYFKPDLESKRLTEKYAQYGFADVDPMIIRPMLEVRAEYIGEAFRAIDEHYDSIESYLENVFGLSSEDLNSFRKQLLD
ncbi:MAG: tyrosine-protein phosphatase [Pseudomonadales bacterium]